MQHMTSVGDLVSDGVGFAMIDVDTSFVVCGACEVGDLASCHGDNCGELRGYSEVLARQDDESLEEAAEEREAAREEERSARATAWVKARVEAGKPVYANSYEWYLERLREADAEWAKVSAMTLRFGEGLTDTTELSDDGDRWAHVRDAHVEEQRAWHVRDSDTRFIDAAVHWKHIGAMRDARLNRMLDWVGKASKPAVAAAAKLWQRQYAAGVKAALGRGKYFAVVAGRPALINVVPSWDRMWLDKSRMERLRAAIATRM